jgi:hypothetical protein
MHDLRVGDDADHGVARVAAGLQIGQDRLHMLFEEQKIGDDDVGMADRVAGGFQRLRVLAPFGGGMDGDRQPREIAGQIFGGPRRGPRRMANRASRSRRGSRGYEHYRA